MLLRIHSKQRFFEKNFFVAQSATLIYTAAMITEIRHAGLEKFYRTGNTAGIAAAHAKQLRFVLLSLDSAYCAQDLPLPQMQLVQDEGLYRLSAAFGTLRFHFAQGNVAIRDYQKPAE